MITRPAEPRDADNMAEWCLTTPYNQMNTVVATYPHLYTFTVEDESGPLLYLPVHPVLSVECVAVRPGIEPREYIEGLLAAKTATENMAQQYGIREIHTRSIHPPMVKALARHGYTPIPGALRKRV